MLQLGRRVDIHIDNGREGGAGLKLGFLPRRSLCLRKKLFASKASQGAFATPSRIHGPRRPFCGDQ